jgi:dihydropteroate synthase
MKKTGLFEFGKKTYIMGILNVTPDSFSDGGKFFSIYDAVNHALRIQNEGADIIDIGGQSTRPGAKEVTVEEEKRRVIPVLEKLSRKIKIPISVDTSRSEVAKEALKLGAKMVNDVTALRGDKNLARIVAHYNVPICLMHMMGEPRNMQENPNYKDVIKEISVFLKERADCAISCGIKKDKIIIDPGLGFGKRTGKGLEDNCEILRCLSEFKVLNYPIMVGASRKAFIGNVCGKDTQLPVTDRLEGSLAAACVAAFNGADIVRVHDVKETRRCLDIVDRIIR